MMETPQLDIDQYGTKIYRVNGKLHREDGPAVEYSDGDKRWFRNGELHREDGPAIEYNGGAKYWYYQNQYVDCSSQEEFKKIIRLKTFW